MRPLTTILLLLTLNYCEAQDKKPSKDAAFSVSHGIVFDKIDSSILKDIRIVHFDNSDGIIFPAEYSRKKFGKNIWWNKRAFFTADTNLIKEIDSVIITQYCRAMQRFTEYGWEETIKDLRGKKDKKGLSTAKQQMADSKKYFADSCPQIQKELIYHDKQYIGFLTEENQKIVYIQLLDFRQDPYKLKFASRTSWIDGWHGWFETNTTRLHYHVDKKILTINEDL